MQEELKQSIFYGWSNITFEIFNTYRTTIDNGNITIPQPSRLKKPDDQPSPNDRLTFKTSQVEQFKRSIKREKSDFMVLKDRKQYKTWISRLRATAAAQDVEEILDPDYKPSTQEDKDLFKEKQKYMYLVAINILQTDRGVVFVGQYDADRNA